ncbi:MAG: GNAT family N-acetyltransferase [Candidatus Obscuribacterales bacterium]|nr:GNAT family N-acetyltransferase [Candidatus Obscuribacterales bacterium]
MNTNKITIIETERCRLRAFTSDKKTVHEIFAFTRDARVAKFVGWYRHLSVKETYKLARKVKNRFYRYGDWNHWLVELKDTGVVIGFIHLYEEFPGLTYELSYALSADYAGKGLMSEVVKSVVKHAFENLKYNRLSARTDKENFASEAILRKVGAEIESEVIEYYIEPNLKLIRDIHYWRLLSKNYFAGKFHQTI